ncbi:MAG: threonine ammonia-lyase [Phycisphaeraceae bacterium]|nr:threonine ammonia-lyase [Phycisphaeraceae bacterium]
MPTPVTIEDIRSAADRISGGVRRTPTLQSEWLSPIVGFGFYLKREHRQGTGSFKERGARNALMRLAIEQKEGGVVSASAGNHALALASHGKQLGIPVTVVMPAFAPIIKARNCEELGAKVILHGDHIGDCREYANQLVDEQGLVYINGYDDPDIIAGAGTIGIELLEQVGEVDAVVVPVGGGGLIAGVAVAVKALKPEVKLIGVEPESASSFSAAMQAGQPVKAEVRPTLADGLAVPCVGANAFAIAAPLIDKMITVNEQEIALAILRLAEMEKAVVEGAGATGVAAALAGKLDDYKGKHVASVLCGGNIDTTMLGRIIQRGMAVDGRLCRFSAHISDRPGGLAAFTRVLADEGVSVIDIAHDRVFGGDEIASVSVECEVETRNHDHILHLRDQLNQAGFDTKFHDLTD